MIRYLLGRLGQTASVLIFVAVISFVLIHAAPGDPFSASLENPNVTEAVRAHWRAQYGLDKPVPEQFSLYVASAARGNLGWSFSHQRPVTDVIVSALPNTLTLMLTALALGFAVGMIVGRIQAARRGTAVDSTLGGVSLFFYSMPDFWLALLALLSLSYWLPLFPVGGSVDPLMHDYLPFFSRVVDRLRHLALPALTLTLILAATVSRFHRAALLDTLPADFVRTARAKGVTERRIMRHHAQRNALFPLISIAGLAIPALFTGAVFVEKIFAWPGMGLVIVNAIGSRDYPLVMGTVLMASVLVALGSLAADILYMVADPRVRVA